MLRRARAPRKGRQTSLKGGLFGHDMFADLPQLSHLFAKAETRKCHSKVSKSPFESAPKGVVDTTFLQWQRLLQHTGTIG